MFFEYEDLISFFVVTDRCAPSSNKLLQLQYFFRVIDAPDLYSTESGHKAERPRFDSWYRQ